MFWHESYHHCVSNVQSDHLEDTVKSPDLLDKTGIEVLLSDGNCHIWVRDKQKFLFFSNRGQLTQGLQHRIALKLAEKEFFHFVLPVGRLFTFERYCVQ